MGARLANLCRELLITDLRGGWKCVGDHETAYIIDVEGLHRDNVIVFSSEEDDEKVSTAIRLFFNIANRYRHPRYSAPEWYPDYLIFLARKLEKSTQGQQGGKDWYDYVESTLIPAFYWTGRVLEQFLSPVLTIDIRREPRIYPVAVRYTEDGKVELLPVDRLYMDEKTALEVTIYGFADQFNNMARMSDERMHNILEKLKNSYAKELKKKHETVIKNVLSAQDLKLDIKRINEFLGTLGVSYDDVKSSVQDWVNKAYTLEEEGRNLAYALSREEPTGTPRFFRLLDTVVEWAGKVVESLEHVKKITEQAFTPDVTEYVTKLTNLFTAIKNGASLGTIGEGTWTTLEELDKTARRLTNRGVLWATKKSFTSLVNTATSAYHALIELMQMYTAGRVLILTTNPLAEEFATVFFKTIEEAQRLGVHIERYDLDPTYIVIRDNEIVMRLGSAPGHACHLDMKNGVLRYYDRDEPVKKEVLRLIRKFMPIKHYKMTDKELVVQFVPIPELVKKLVAIMPLVISMDIRLQNTNWIDFWTVTSEYLKKGDVDGILDIFEELEVSRETVYEIAKTLQEALSSADESSWNEYIKEKHKDLVKYLEELGKALKTHEAETIKAKKKTASKNNRKTLAMTT